jgi:murein DD-endopeptidase MepM/ murein hydrolase activator NlpD
VRFSGMVAGRGVVVIAHADGVVTEYEPVRARVGAGTRVIAGEVIATVRGAHRTCAPDRCLHWSARREGNYLDPMSLLGELGTVRLLPWSGTPP